MEEAWKMRGKMIRKATVEDLPSMEDCAKAFYAASQFLKEFQLDKFIHVWTALIESDAGVIFILESDGEIAGLIGGMAYSDLYSDTLIGTEFFWWVHEAHRGGRGGIALYRTFEAWAVENGCSQIRMVHLSDSMPEKLERVYTHLGFIPAEVHYVKELTK